MACETEFKELTNINVQVNKDERLLTLNFGKLTLDDLIVVRNMWHGNEPVACRDWVAAAHSLQIVLDNALHSTRMTDKVVVGADFTVIVHYADWVSYEYCFATIRDLLQSRLPLICTLQNS